MNRSQHFTFSHSPGTSSQTSPGLSTAGTTTQTSLSAVGGFRNFHQPTFGLHTTTTTTTAQGNSGGKLLLRSGLRALSPDRANTARGSINFKPDEKDAATRTDVADWRLPQRRRGQRPIGRPSTTSNKSQRVPLLSSSGAVSVSVSRRQRQVSEGSQYTMAEALDHPRPSPANYSSTPVVVLAGGMKKCQSHPMFYRRTTSDDREDGEDEGEGEGAGEGLLSGDSGISASQGERGVLEEFLPMERVFRWLTGVTGQAEPPPSPEEIDDQPIQTDTAFHFVHEDKD